MITTNTVTSTARDVIDAMRGEGIPIGLVKLRLFRPFPVEDIVEALRGVKKIAMLDRNLTFGQCGVFASEIKAALYDYGLRTPLFDYVLGLGGRDVTPKLIRQVADHVLTHDTPDSRIIWMGVKA